MTGVYVAVGLVAASALAETGEQYNTAKDQASEAAAGVAQQQILNEKAQQQAGATAQQIAQNEKNQTGSTTATQTAAYAKALAQAQQATAAEGAQANTAGASKKYQQTAAQAAANNSNFGNTMAGVYGAATAPEITATQNNEALMQGESQLGLLGGQSGQQSYLTQLQVAADQPNPLVMGAAGAAGAAGSALGTYSAWNANPDTPLDQTPGTGQEATDPDFANDMENASVPQNDNYQSPQMKHNAFGGPS